MSLYSRPGRTLQVTRSIDEEEEDRSRRRGSDKWDWPLRTSADFVNATNTRDKFRVELEAQLFSPDEIEVRTHDNEIWIHFKHEESKGKKYGLVAREFQRCYKLPEDVNMSSVRTHLRKDGMLVIDADKS